MENSKNFNGNKIFDLKLPWINTTLGKLHSPKNKSTNHDLPPNLEFLGKNTDGSFLVKSPDSSSFSHDNLPAFWKGPWPASAVAPLRCRRGRNLAL